MGSGEDASEFMNEVGNRLRIVESRFKNRADVAYKAGVSKSTFQRWVEGKADPSFKALAKLADVTGFSLDWLATGLGDMGPGFPGSRVGETTEAAGKSAGARAFKPAMPPSDPDPSGEPGELSYPAFLRRVDPPPEEEQRGTSFAVPKAATAFEEEFHGRLIEGIMSVYGAANAGLPPRHLGQLAARIHRDMMAANLSTPEEKSAALRFALEQIRRELLSPEVGSSSSKRLA